MDHRAGTLTPFSDMSRADAVIAVFDIALFTLLCIWIALAHTAHHIPDSITLLWRYKRPYSEGCQNHHLSDLTITMSTLTILTPADLDDIQGDVL